MSTAYRDISTGATCATGLGLLYTNLIKFVKLLTVKIFFNISYNHGKDGSTGDLPLPMEAQALVPTRLHQPGNTHSLTGWLFSAVSSKICSFLTKTTPCQHPLIHWSPHVS